jgi:hypothetical protein
VYKVSFNAYAVPLKERHTPVVGAKRPETRAVTTPENPVRIRLALTAGLREVTDHGSTHEPKITG